MLLADVSVYEPKNIDKEVKPKTKAEIIYNIL